MNVDKYSKNLPIISNKLYIFASEIIKVIYIHIY